MATLVPVFGQKNKIFPLISGIWHKILPKIIFLSQYLNCLYENPDIDKSGGIKIQIFLLAKIE